MPILLEDLAEEASASNRRVADRLDELRRAAGTQEEVLEAARQAIVRAVSRLPEAEGFWQGALTALRKEPTGEQTEQLLRLLLRAFESSLQLVNSSRALWDAARQMGATPEGLEELNGAERRFEELAAQARRALEHRTGAWQAADPDRLAEGLKLTREGKTVKADEARAWFRTTQR